MDEMVYQTQRWLNQTYGDNEGFGSVTENGKTGWETIYALTRALQIELGIEETANNFGPTSRALYAENPLRRQDGISSNKFAILQGTLWCKGYNPGHYYADGIIDGYSRVFDNNVEDAVKRLQTDAGIESPDGIVSVNLMAALLSMDAFQLLSAYGGKEEIRIIQQEMNRKYEDYIGIMPCDGVYGRNTNKAYIKALQCEMGMSVNVATGNIGDATRRCLPEIPYNGDQLSYTGHVYSAAQIMQFTKLFKFGLYVNGFGSGDFSGVLQRSAVLAFQAHHALPQTGIADLQTWLSVLISCGDRNRKGTAADTRFEITESRLQILKSNGYQIVGRYLTGGDFKEIRDGELQRIFNGGLSVFPIYQSSGTDAAYFSAERGVIAANAAEQAARQKGIPRGTIIYFAVDFDAMDHHITDNILPHFESVARTLSGYRVGIYGPRNVCSRVAAAGYSVSSFVSDMSTGFSGNLGFQLPLDWAFDQISNIYISHSGVSLEIDNDIFSGRDQGFNTLTGYISPDEGYAPAPPVDSFGQQGTVLINRSSMDIPVYSEIVLSEIHTGGCTVGGEIIGYIEPNDFYSRSRYSDSMYITSYGVTIHCNNGNGIKQGYIETSPGYTLGNHPWVRYQEPFHFYNTDGSNLVESELEIINGESYYIFTSKKELDRRNSEGTLLTRLPKGTKLATKASTAGKTYPNMMYFQYYLAGFWKGVGDHYIDIDGNDVDIGGFVDLGLQWGCNVSERVIW